MYRLCIDSYFTITVFLIWKDIPICMLIIRKMAYVVLKEGQTHCLMTISIGHYNHHVKGLTQLSQILGRYDSLFCFFRRMDFIMIEKTAMSIQP